MQSPFLLSGMRNYTMFISSCSFHHVHFTIFAPSYGRFPQSTLVAIAIVFFKCKPNISKQTNHHHNVWYFSKHYGQKKRSGGSSFFLLVFANSEIWKWFTVIEANPCLQAHQIFPYQEISMSGMISSTTNTVVGNHTTDMEYMYKSHVGKVNMICEWRG
jgi:hypothetical protein